MKKHLLMAAMACVPAMPASAEVTISGKVYVGPYFSTSTAAASGEPAPTNQITEINNQNPERYKQAFSKEGITSSDSLINLNASLDIGRGMKVLFQYQLDISETGAALTNTGHRRETNDYLFRTGNSYLGIAGPWGALKLGTNENVYEQYLYEADPLDNSAGLGGNVQMFGSPGYGVVFDVGQMEVSREYGQAGFYRRTDQNIWYESPDIKGFSFGAACSLAPFQKEAATEDPVLGSTSPRVISLGAQYKPSYLPFYVNVAYELHKDLFGTTAILGSTNNGRTSSDTGLKAQAGLALRLVTVGAIVEKLKYTVDQEKSSYIREYQRMAYGLHAKVNLPFGYIGLNAGLAQNGKYRLIDQKPAPGEDDVDESAVLHEALDSKALFFGLGYFHNITEKVQVQVMASLINNGVNASYSLASGATCNQRIPGADHKAIYTGIKYSF